MPVVGLISHTEIVQSAIDALALGSLYSLYALGIALVFSVMGLINFAHGELIMIGGFALALLVGVMPLGIVLVVVAVVVVLAALTMERVAFRPVRGADPATLLITSFAVSYLLQNLAILIFGATPRTLSLGSWLGGSFTIAGNTVQHLSVATVIATAVLLAALVLFLGRTALGLRMRAAAEDFRMARLLGVRANRVIATAFAISGLLAAAGSVFLVAQTGTVTPDMGLTAILFAFMAAILGGIGSLPGAVAGGYLLGITTVLFQVWLPFSLRPYRDAFVFGVVFVVLVLRPQGLIPTRGHIRV
ncbi:MAG: branched-chain amino acid ABC transporter permease [Solirubrobacterales bacterium]